MKLVKIYQSTKLMLLELFSLENEQLVIMNQIELELAVERVRQLRLSKEIMQELRTAEAAQQKYDSLAN